MFHFTRSKDELKTQYKALSLKTHPDRGGSVEQFQQLQDDYKMLQDVIDQGKPWDYNNELSWYDNGTTTRFKYANKVEINGGVGIEYIGKTNLISVIDPNALDLAENAISIMKHLASNLGPTPKIVEQNADLFPVGMTLKNGSVNYTAVRKPIEYFPLDVALKLIPDTLTSPEHVAWCVGRVLHILCTLNYAKIMHGGLHTSSIYVNLDTHELALLSGWFYSRRFGEKLVALPVKSLPYMPDAMKNDKLASKELDMSCAYRTILDICGVNSPKQLIGKFPDPFVEFLKFPFRGDPFDLYKEWERVRESSFSKRIFVKIDSTIVHEKFYG